MLNAECLWWYNKLHSDMCEMNTPLRGDWAPAERAGRLGTSSTKNFAILGTRANGTENFRKSFQENQKLINSKPF